MSPNLTNQDDDRVRRAWELLDPLRGIEVPPMTVTAAELRRRAEQRHHGPASVWWWHQRALMTRGRMMTVLTAGLALTLATGAAILTVGLATPAVAAPAPLSMDIGDAPPSARAWLTTTAAELTAAAGPTETAPPEPAPPTAPPPTAQTPGGQGAGDQITEQNTGNQSTGNQSTGNQSTGNQSTGTHSTTGQSTAGQGAAGQTSIGRSRTGQTSAGLPSTGQSVTGQTSIGPSATGQTSTSQTSTGQSIAGQGATGQGIAGQGAAGQSTTGQTLTGQTAVGQRAAAQGTAEGALWDGAAGQGGLEMVASGLGAFGLGASGTGAGGLGSGDRPNTYVHLQRWAMDTTSAEHDLYASDLRLWWRPDTSAVTASASLPGQPSGRKTALWLLGPPAGVASEVIHHPAGSYSLLVDRPAAEPGALSRQLETQEPSSNGPQATLRSLAAFAQFHYLDLRQRAGMLSVLAGVEGIRLRGKTTDRAGRPGVAVSVDSGRSGSGSVRDVLVLSPRGELLSHEQITLTPPPGVTVPRYTVTAYTLYLESERTNDFGP